MVLVRREKEICFRRSWLGSMTFVILIDVWMVILIIFYKGDRVEKKPLYRRKFHLIQL